MLFLSGILASIFIGIKEVFTMIMLLLTLKHFEEPQLTHVFCAFEKRNPCNCLKAHRKIKEDQDFRVN